MLIKKSLLLLIFFTCVAAFSQDLHEGDASAWDDEFFFTDNEGITIVGTLPTTQQMAVIDREEIERSSAPDIASLLQETLHLNIDRYGPHGNQSNITLRGISSRRVAILVNGVPVNSAMDGRFDIYQIDLNSIERIEVIYGGSDSRFNVSGAIGGVINIITIRKQEPGWRFSGSVSNTSYKPTAHRDRNGVTQDPNAQDIFDTQNFSVVAAFGGETFSFSANAFANRAANHFNFYDSFGFRRRKDNNEVWDGGLNASGIWNLAGLTNLIASTNFYYADKNIPTSGFSSRFGEQVDFSSRQSLMIEAPRAFHDDFAAEAVLAWRFNRMDYTSPSGAFSRHDQYTVNAINRWSWFPGEKLILRSGVDYRFTLLDSTAIGNRDRHDGGIYLTAEYKPVRQFMITPSIKTVAATGNAGGITTVPKLGLIWRLTDSLIIKNNYFRSFKFPEFEELYWDGGGSAMSGIGNPNLLPEDGWGGDIGVTSKLGNRIQMENVFFTQWLRNSIHWFSGSGNIWRPENVGEAIFFGIDNKLNFEIPVSQGPLNKIILSVSYQYLRSYLLSFGYTFASDKRIPYNPEHTIGCSLDFIWKTGSLLISGHYESLRFHDRANLTTLNPVFLLNAGFNQKINNNLAVFGALRNILNTSYESFYDYPMPGISLTLGVRANLEVK